MERDQVLTMLRLLEPELRREGVLGVSVFGSVAPDEATRDSDVDIAVRLEDRFSRGGLDYFRRLDQLRERLAERLGRRVDIVVEPARKQRLNAEIERDRAIAF